MKFKIKGTKVEFWLERVGNDLYLKCDKIKDDDTFCCITPNGYLHIWDFDGEPYKFKILD